MTGSTISAPLTGQRLRVTAQMPLQDVESGRRRSLTEQLKDLGAVALVLPSNPVNRRPWYHPYYEPLVGLPPRS